VPKYRYKIFYERQVKKDCGAQFDFL